MKKNLLLPILFTFFGLSMNAQLTFQKTFGNTGNELVFSVQQTTDGGYVIGGVTSSFGAGGYDLYLIRTDANGDTLWTRTFGGATNNEYGYAVQQTMDGGYIVTGSVASFGAGNTDVYLVRTDAAGNLLWSKTFGGTANENGYSLQQTSDSGFVVAGYTNSFGAGNFDFYVIRTDAQGDTLWTRTFGSIGLDEGRSVRQTADGGYVISGNTNFGGTGGYDVLLIRLDALGNLQWTRSFGGTGNESGYSLQQTTDKGFIISGYTSSFGAGINDAYLLKTDSMGTLLWARAFGGTGNEFGNYTQQTSDGGYILSGTSSSFGAGNNDVYLVKTDVNGDTLWTRTIGGSNIEYNFSTQQTADGGYIISSHSQSFGMGLHDVYLIKTDVNGNAGCNTGSSNTLVNIPVSSVASPAIQVSYGAIVGNPATQTSYGSVNGLICTTAGVKGGDGTAGRVTIFPNPFSAQTTLQTGEFLENASLTIYNSMGQQVKQIRNIFGQTFTLFRDDLPGGLYFVHLTQNNKTIWMGKLVVTD